MRQETNIHSAPIRSELLDRDELASEFGISTRTLDRWQSKRSGPPRVKIGKFIFYRRQAVLDWIAQSEQKTLRPKRA
jgi:predicted DNA-binding transcriptional regulator AlpA